MDHEKWVKVGWKEKLSIEKSNSHLCHQEQWDSRDLIDSGLKEDRLMARKLEGDHQGYDEWTLWCKENS